MPKGTDEIFTSNMFSEHGKHVRLKRVATLKDFKGARQRQKINGFAVRHYAGQVIYDAAAFLVKNNDQTSEDTVTMCLKSNYTLVQQLLVEEENVNTKKNKTKQKQKKKKRTHFFFFFFFFFFWL